MKSLRVLAISMIMALLINGSAHAASLQLLAPITEQIVNIDYQHGSSLEAPILGMNTLTANNDLANRVPILTFDPANIKVGTGVSLSKSKINSVKLNMFVGQTTANTYNHLFRISGIPGNLSNINDPGEMFKSNISNITFEHLGAAKAFENSWSEWNISAKSGATISDFQNLTHIYAILALSSPTIDGGISAEIGKIPSLDDKAQNVYYGSNFASTKVDSLSPYMAVDYTEQPVPEPSTIILGLMGIAGALGLKRKKVSC